MDSLTDIQQAVYDYTRKALQQGRPFPSLREIAGHFGFQHTTARFHLKALEKKGYVQQRSQRVSDYLLHEPGLHEPGLHEPGLHEQDLSSELLSEQDLLKKEGISASSFDLVARIPAGAPSAVFDETPESFSVTYDFFGGGDILGLRVVGDSMSGDSIADGDIAMIKRQRDANKGDILALRIEDEITLKRLRIKGDEAQLLPSNPEYSMRVVPARQLEILGKLVGIIRKV